MQARKPITYLSRHEFLFLISSFLILRLVYQKPSKIAHQLEGIHLKIQNALLDLLIVHIVVLLLHDSCILKLMGIISHGLEVDPIISKCN